MISWLGVGLALILAVMFVILVKVYRVSRDISESNKRMVELRSLSLNPRTRVTRASMQSGATVPEQELKRLAHTSRARRVVVGGDESSEQYQQLNYGMAPREDETDA